MQGMILHSILINSLCEFKTSVQFDCIYAFVYFCFLFYNSCRILSYFGCRELCCIQFWQQVICIQNMQLIWKHICLRYLKKIFITIIAGTWKPLDAEIDAASNTGTNLSASNNAGCNNRKCSNFSYFGCKKLCCIQYCQQFFCIQNLQIVWLHI